MDTIGLDLHKRESQLCILTEEGEIVKRRIATTRERFTAVLGNRPPARILLEASTESEGWVARHLESLGHEVIVADPNFAPMYATRSRRVKTDRRDAQTLAEALRLGAYRAIHRAPAAQRHVRAQLAVRDALIRTRTRYVNVVRALTRRDGLRLPCGGPEHLEAKLAALPLPALLAAEVAPLRVLLGSQAEIHMRAAQDADAAMLRVQQMLERLSFHLQPDEQAVLQTAQSAWERYIDLQARLATEAFKGGTIMPTIYHSERSALARERERALKRLLDTFTL